MAELMVEKFGVEFLPEAVQFLEKLEPKARQKILYNIRKSQFINDKELFKKLTTHIWEFRTLFNKTYYRLFAFHDRTEDNEVMIVAAHGLVKKSAKTPRTDLEKAEQTRLEYFKHKNKYNGNSKKI